MVITEFDCCFVCRLPGWSDKKSVSLKVTYIIGLVITQIPRHAPIDSSFSGWHPGGFKLTNESRKISGCKSVVRPIEIRKPGLNGRLPSDRPDKLELMLTVLEVAGECRR